MVRFLKLLVIVPVAIVIVGFAIANRQGVSVFVDPFTEPTVAAAVITAPLFLLLFLALIVGTFLGGVAAWLRGGVHRRRAREAADEAEHWRLEARRLREAPPVVMSQPIEASTGRALIQPGT